MGAMLVPAASVPQDFSREVVYTVVAADGSKKAYTVKVSALPQPAAVIAGFSKDTVRAGEAVSLIGKHFDGFTSSIQIALTGSSGKETKVNFKLIDSTRLTITIPETIEPGGYRVKMAKGNTQAVSVKSLLVRVPLPVISSIRRSNILEGDTLMVAGRFLWPERYDYRLYALGDKGEFICSPFEKNESKLVSDLFDPIHKMNLPPGNYKLSVFIFSGEKAWTDAAQTIRVYSKELPFITGFEGNKVSYRAAETVTMTTRAFEKLNARFYQVQLLGQSVQYNQNAIYSAAGKQLLISLPADIKPGAYAVRIAYLSDNGSTLYDQDLDDIITITQ
nr:hypothetical protein [Dyadobacter jiangsuensis]